MSPGAAVKTGVESMATPKKFYPVVDGIDLSSCRLCGSIGDSKHCKNLFKPANAVILVEVEKVHGNVLLRDKALPQLICRPCERKVNNASNLKIVIVNTQTFHIQKTSRSKRCIDISPSTPLPKVKTRCRKKLTKEALNFETDATSSSSISQVSFKFQSQIYNIIQELQ